MKWISALEMENFKIHINKRVEFGRYMNVLVGESDRGKSIALKAIIKCLLNKPERKAETFIPFSKRDQRGVVTKIRCYIKDDENGNLSEEHAKEYCIERIISKTLNEYNITYPDGTTTNYSKFGKTVPPEVMSIHGMREVDMGYGKEHLNYLSQFDGFFLLGRRGEEVATALGRLARTDIIDTVAAGLRSDIDSSVKAKNRKIRELREIEEKIESFEWIKGAEQEIEEVERLLAKIEAYEVAYENIKRLALPIKDLSAEMTLKYEKIKSTVDYSKSIELLDNALHAKQMSKGISDIMDSIEDLSDDISEIRDRLSHAPNFDKVHSIVSEMNLYMEKVSTLSSISLSIKKLASEMEARASVEGMDTDFEKVIDLSRRAVEAMSEYDTIASISKDIIASARTLEARHEKLGQSEKSLEKAKMELQEAMKGSCPVCGNPLEGSDITVHLQEV